MAKYSVHVFCDECGDVHPMSIVIELADGPADKASVGDTYQGRNLPPQIAALINNRIICPKTRRWILQRNNQQVFLVPVA
jgi:hypothetical protein